MRAFSLVLLILCRPSLSKRGCYLEWNSSFPPSFLSTRQGLLKMPIVGSTRYNETITSMRPEEPWFHPTVVTTSTSGTFPPDNMPDLTTVYTPPPSCVNRWMLPNVLGAVPTVYSTSPIASNGRQMGQDSFYLACQRFSTLTYSPGVCTDAQAIVEMTEVRTTGVTGDVGTFWQASCCNRSVDHSLHNIIMLWLVTLIS